MTPTLEPCPDCDAPTFWGQSQSFLMVRVDADPIPRGEFAVTGELARGSRGRPCPELMRCDVTYDIPSDPYPRHARHRCDEEALDAA